MTPEDFSCRAFWTVTEVANLSGIPRRKAARWLKSAGMSVENAFGVWIVHRTTLEERCLEILLTMERRVRMFAEREPSYTPTAYDE